MSEVSTWNAVDASNSATPPDGFPEGMQPSAVNDSARMMMGALRREHDRVTAQIGSTPGAISTTTINVTTVSATGNISASTLNTTGNASVGGTLTAGNGHVTSAMIVDHGIQYPSYGIPSPAVNIGLGYSYATGFLYIVANDAFVGTLGPVLSDERLKRDIEPVSVDPLEALCGIELRAFNQISARNDPADGVRHRDIGFIAQQVREVIPDAAVEPITPDGYLGLDLMPLVAYCVGAIQQLAERVARLEKERADV